MKIWEKKNKLVSKSSKLYIQLSPLASRIKQNILKQNKQKISNISPPHIHTHEPQEQIHNNQENYKP